MWGWEGTLASPWVRGVSGQVGRIIISFSPSNQTGCGACQARNRTRIIISCLSIQLGAGRVRPGIGRGRRKRPLPAQPHPRPYGYATAFLKKPTSERWGWEGWGTLAVALGPHFLTVFRVYPKSVGERASSSAIPAQKGIPTNDQLIKSNINAHSSYTQNICNI